MAKKYLDKDKYPFAKPGEVRVLFEIEPTNAAATNNIFLPLYLTGGVSRSTKCEGGRMGAVSLTLCESVQRLDDQPSRARAFGIGLLIQLALITPFLSRIKDDRPRHAIGTIAGPDYCGSRNL